MPDFKRLCVHILLLSQVSSAVTSRRESPDNLLLPNFILNRTLTVLSSTQPRALRAAEATASGPPVTTFLRNEQRVPTDSSAIEKSADGLVLPSRRQYPLQNLAAAPAPQAGAEAPAPSQSQVSAPSPASSSFGMDPRSVPQKNSSLAKWFTWRFWQLIVGCVVTLLFFSEVLGPLIHRFLLNPSFLLDSMIFGVQMITLMLVASALSETGAAGGENTLALATVMASVSVLLMIGALSLKFQKTSEQTRHVMDDVAGLFRPFSRLIAVFLIVHGVLEETSADWGNLVLFGSFAALGIAFAMTGLVQNIMSYVMIRLDDYFREGDWVYYQNELYQVQHIYWRYTLAYRLKTRSHAYIPNREIGQLGVNNQSRDDTRFLEMHLPLPMGMSSASLEAVVKGTWEVLHGLEEAGFVAMNGQKMDCQFDVAKSTVWIDGVDVVLNAQEFAAVKLHLKLAGKYFFSKPPHWQKEGPEPAPQDRQLEWQAGWNYQLEWFIIQVKKLFEQHSPR